MDQRTIGIYLSRILSGSYLFLHNGSKYKLVYPDISLKYEAELYAQEEYESAKYNDWIKDEEIVHFLVDAGLWNYQADTNLKNLETQIEDQKVELYKNHLNPTKVKSIRKTLSNVKNNLNKNHEIRHSFDHLTLDGYINILKNQYLIIRSLYDHNNNIVFKSVDDTDYNLLNSITSLVARETISSTTFRAIARNEQWKNYWSANNETLFDKPTINWTDEQKTLVVISRMYDSAYQHPECPPDNIIEDDDMFDGWMIIQRKEAEKIKNKNRAEKMFGVDKHKKANEVFIVANSQEEAKNIYDLNDPTSRHIIRERENTLKRVDAIDDINLPDVQRNLVNQANQMFKDTRKK